MTDRPELRKRSANFVPLSPVSFLARAAAFFGDRVAVVHGERRFTYRQFYARARQLAHALTKAGISRGDTVAILAANTPAMLEAHYAAPMIGAVLNPDQHPPRCAADRLLPRARRGQAAAGRPRVPRHHRPGAREARAQAPDRHRHRRCGDGRARRGSAASSTRTSSPRAIRSSPTPAPRTSGTPSACSTPPAPPATPRAPSTAIAAPTSARSPTRSPSSSTTRAATCGRCRCSTARAGPTPGRSRRRAATHVCLRKVEPKRIFDAIAEHRDHAHVRGADRAQHARPRAGRRQARPAAAHQGGNRRRRAAGRRHRAHGGDGLRGAAPLRHHRELRALGLLRADVGVAGAVRRPSATP